MQTVAILYFCLIYFRYTLCDSPSNDLEIESVNDVYEYLWENNKDIAYKTLQSDFLKQMKNGSLQAERYLNFTIQDINYILKVRDMLEKVSANVTSPDDLQTFIKGRYSSYNKLSDYMLAQYLFMKDPPIQAIPAMQNYLASYRELMAEPLYFVVGLLPCSRLWFWLGNNIKTPPNTAYYNWMIANKEGHPEKFKALLIKYLNTAQKVAKANAIFRMQMQNEYDFFIAS